MRIYIGTTLLALLGIVLSSVTVATHVWQLGIIAVLSVLGAILAYPARKPERKPERTAFGVGDFSGSTFVNVYSDADDFIRGNARQALFLNIIHMVRNRKRR